MAEMYRTVGTADYKHVMLQGVLGCTKTGLLQTGILYMIGFLLPVLRNAFKDREILYITLCDCL
jgi:hypothetical protein